MSFLKYAWPWQYRWLIWQFTRREVLGRYRGSMLGLGWSLLSPIMMLAAFTFVFVGVFNARWPSPGPEHNGIQFGLQVFAGLLIFNWFAEVASRAPRLILDQPNLVKKVVFPLHTLTWVSVASSFFHMMLGMLVLILATGLFQGRLPITAIALPLVLIAFTPFLFGVSWALSALGTYLRDVAQMMGLIVSLTMFLSPVFYSSKSLTGVAHLLMQLNPLTTIIENVRRVLLDGTWPEWQALGMYTVLAALVSLLAAKLFDGLRRGFADVV